MPLGLGNIFNGFFKQYGHTVILLLRYIDIAMLMLVTVVYLVLAPRTYKADGLLRIDKNPSALMAGYQAVGDWLGLRQDRHFLPAAEPEEQVTEEVQT